MGTAMMSAEEVGCYIRLLCYQWDAGAVPNDDAAICRLSGGNANAIPSLRQKFEVCEDGLLRNPRMETERTKQRAFREKQAENGAKRWSGNAKPMPSLMPNTCSPSPSPSPISDSVTNKDKAATPPFSSDSFIAAWNEWIAYRKERNLPSYKPRSLKAQWNEMLAWGEGPAIDSINESIRQQWQGLFAPKTNGAPRQMAAPTAADHKKDPW